MWELVLEHKPPDGNSQGQHHFEELVHAGVHLNHLEKVTVCRHYRQVQATLVDRRTVSLGTRRVRSVEAVKARSRCAGLILVGQASAPYQAPTARASPERNGFVVRARHEARCNGMVRRVDHEVHKAPAELSGVDRPRQANGI